MWDVMEADVAEPNRRQTAQQAVDTAVQSFLWACDWDGYGLPSFEDVLAEFERRGARVLPDRAFLERVATDKAARWQVAPGSYGLRKHRVEVARLREH